ncbi:hypothetical protein Z957_12010 [Clostridium sp. K25]|uniref:hypothetical protein n=1 Tax=Clostridium sp. K25 TaxID=1443109 RepID=UPI0004D9CBEE|nr:hypothetical protein [Clostridium sp. K25]KEI06585.1 hypothetical protein Z957_12010 [Clostridium sp. K25]
MNYNFLEDKIKVFISSKCGVNNYDIIRLALKRLLEETGFIKAYVFEETVGSTSSARDEYLSKLEDSHVVLFLIDNQDEKFPEGVMKEFVHAEKIEKKAIYIFFNDPNKEKTSIQKKLVGYNGAKFKEVNNLKEFIDEGYKCIIEDIIGKYNQYCRNRLTSSVEHYEIQDSDKNINNKLDIGKFKYKECLLNEKKFNNLSKTLEYFTDIWKKNDDNKSFENSMDKFCYDFIKFLIGDLEYNKISFCNLENYLKQVYSEDIYNIILKRWEAIKAYYNGDNCNAIKILENVYKYTSEVDCSQWLIDDILIDKRNLEYKSMNYSNKICLETEAQKELNKKEDFLYCPFIDRMANDIHTNILKEIYDKSMESPYTTTIGTKINSILKDIGRYFIIAIYNGSLTHISLTIRLLKETFINFSIFNNYYKWKYLSLKFIILDCDMEKFSQICDRNSSILSSCSFEKIYELYKLTDIIPYSKEREKVKLELFKKLGYYFSNEQYNVIQKEIFTITNKWIYSEEIVVKLGVEIFESLLYNVYRINVKEVLEIILKIFDKKFFRFYDSSFKILYNISWKREYEEYYKQIIDYITEIIKDKNIRDDSYELRTLIIYLRKGNLKLSYSWDALIKEYWKEFYVDEYSLEINELSKEEIEKCILKFMSEIEFRMEKQGKDGSYSGYADNLFLTIKNIIEFSKVKVDEKNIFNPLTIILKKVLTDPKQTTGDKISSIYLLFYMKEICLRQNIKFNWQEYNDKLFESEQYLYNSFEDGFFDKRSSMTLKLNLLFWKIINNRSNEEEVLNIFSSYYSVSPFESIELMKIMEIYLKSCSIHKKFDYKLIILQLLMFKAKDNSYEVRVKTITCLFELLNTEFGETILNILCDMLEDKDYRIRLLIIKNINKIEEKYKYTFKSMLEKAIVDNHYLVRRQAKLFMK